MRPRTEAILLVLETVAVSGLLGQGRDVDFSYGRWSRGHQISTYELRTLTPISGIFGHGLAGYALVDEQLGRQRAFYGAGWELQAMRHRRRTR